MENKELERELRRQIEINKEKEKLNEVISTINNQIIELVDDRKKVMEFIVKYREKNVEEYKYDEDKQIDYFNHELYVKEEQFRLIEKRLRELTILSKSPYFGKIHFEDKYGKMKIYIGRFGVTDEKAYEPIVVDWRSPVSSLFYQEKLGKAEYIAPEGKEKAYILGKRQFIIKNTKLEGMFDSSMNVKDEILQFILSKNTDEKLKNIVMTIQKEQDDLIRQPRNGVMVVNGASGSGKTTIALHRVAYLLYNYRKELQNRVLILGPNSIFMDYISMVLPSLGEEKVRQTTFREFACEIIGENNNNIIDFKDYMENLLENNNDFKEKVKYKRSLRYIQDMDNLILNLENNYFKIQDVNFYDKIIVKKSEIEDMMNSSFKYMPLFKRSIRILKVIYARIRDERNRRVKKIQDDYKKMISNMNDDQLNISATDIEFKRKSKIRDVIGEVIKIKREKLKWLENPDIINVYNSYNKNERIMDEDLAPILYLKIKLEGLSYNKHLKHIVIDEAQDYSALEFKVIKEVTGCKSFTIVGDINQKIIPVNEQFAMLNLHNIFLDLDIKYFSLKTSYRSTNEILEYANRYLSENKVRGVRSGEKVVVYEVDDINKLVKGIIKSISKFKEKGYESIAVVCRSLKETEILSNILKEKIHINVFDREDIIYSKGEVIIPSYFAKGLEFDAVIMIDDFSDNDENANKVKYVMSTRALHQLCVYKIPDIF